MFPMFSIKNSLDLTHIDKFDIRSGSECAKKGLNGTITNFLAVTQNSSFIFINASIRQYFPILLLKPESHLLVTFCEEQ